MRGRRTRDRGVRSKPKRKAKRAAPGNVRRHARFGDIPLYEASVEDERGRVHRYLAYDLGYRPALPSGAVRADPRKQEFCPICHVPRYFYEDIERECLQCGERFVFSGAEQKHWYEVLKFHFDSTAIRCKACRRKRRSLKLIERQVAVVRERIERAPDDPAPRLELARALVLLRADTGRGSMNDAIAAARRARKLAGSSPHWRRSVAETLYWEARAQTLAGRAELAKKSFRDFVDRVGRQGRFSAWVEEAQAVLQG